MILYYDGSFEGFLTLVYDVYYNKLSPTKITKDLPQDLFFKECDNILTDEIKAKKVNNALKNKFPKKSYESIFNTFLCDTKDFELHLLNFIIIGFKNPKNLENINLVSVKFIIDLQKELFSMVHKMTGFVRFEELSDNTLYAKIETKFNGLPYLGKHFVKRLGNCNFIIHDINRKLAFIHFDKKNSIENISDYEEPQRSKDEEKFKKLWKTFFQSVTIESRENKKVQRNFVPLLYRKYMSEFD